jgi:hypothetical protein
MPIYKITQHVLHTILVQADDADQADEFAGELGDDDFTDKDWGDVTITEMEERLVRAHDCINDIRREQ